jgi:hypothetical protein
MSVTSLLTQIFTGNRPAATPRRNDRSRNLSLESLEKRQVMAGNVFVMHANDALQIWGDTQDNQVAITETAPGRVQVAGLNNTTVNGRSSILVFNNPSDNLNIIMGNGNDLVLLGKNGGSTSRFNNVVVNTGAGSDSVMVNNTVAYGNAFSSFNLGDDGQNEGDVMRFDRCNFRAAAIGTGGGDDQVSSLNSTITKAIINTGGGNDIVDLRSTASAELAVSLGDGDDRFASWNSRPSRSRWVHGGSGWDGLKVGGESRSSGTSEYLGFNYQQKW